MLSAYTCQIEKSIEYRWRRGFKAESFARSWMSEAQDLGMQRHPVEFGDRSGQGVG
jgi:hypothetical protein